MSTLIKSFVVVLVVFFFCILIGIKSCGAATLAERNNNPVNLKAFVQWDGMTGRDKHGHAIFASLDYGIRAALKNAQTRQRRAPNQTLREWMNEFAEENGDQEAEYIARKMGISSTTALRDIDMTALVVHQAMFEGRISLTVNQVLSVKQKFGI